MGFRFSRRLRILPGLRLNVSKSGVSTSIGRRGAWLTLGRKGTRATVGLPGTGLSYTSRLGRSASSAAPTAPGAVAGPEDSARRAGPAVWFWIMALGLIVLFVTRSH